MKIAAFLLLFVSIPVIAQDADTLLKVQKARAEVPSCTKLLKDSQRTGSMMLEFMKYSDLNVKAEALSHCGFVFRIVGDNARADDAGNESDRYDATVSLQMEKFLKAKGLWAEFVKMDCRIMSESCGH